MKKLGMLLRLMFGQSEDQLIAILNAKQSAGAVNQHEIRIQGLKRYMLEKIEDRDWHAVADAAMDIRESEAIIAYLKEKYDALKERKQ